MHVLDELKARGFVQQCSDEAALRAALDAGPVPFYAGFDPTAPSLHVGHLLPVLMMAHLQRAGHPAIVVVGGGTGQVGDPSGKTEARQLLAAEAIEANVAAIGAQIGRFVDLADPARGRLVDNGAWLMPLRYIDFLRDIGKEFSVNRMLSAEGYKQRLERGLSFIEFNYQILQAYDFLVLHERHGVRLQLGGDDQWGNILAGVDLVRRKHHAQAFALTLPLLVTASGQKMGKTHTGAVWIDAERFSPFDFYQHWLNTDDRDVGRFLRLFTFLPLDRIADLEALRGASLRDAKAVLAHEVTAMVHGAPAADRARDAAAAMVANAASEALPTHTVTAAQLAAGLPVVTLLREAGLAASSSEARRLVQQGGVRRDGQLVTDVQATLGAADVRPEGTVLRVGKKAAVRVVPGG